MLMRPKPSLDRLLTLKPSAVYDLLVGGFTAHRSKYAVLRKDPGPALVAVKRGDLAVDKVPVVIDKSKREDGTFSREDFTFDKDRNVYICPANKILTTTGKLVTPEPFVGLAVSNHCAQWFRCCPEMSVPAVNGHPRLRPPMSGIDPP
jgi:hypothetical protein